MKSLLDQFPNEEDLIKQIMNISATVWKHEITGKDIQSWLDNFTGAVFTKEEERLIALWLLTHFVYYNEEEVRHLCKVLYNDFVHFVLEKENCADDQIDEVTKSKLSKYTFSHLGKGSESGAFILYFFRQQNKLALMSFPKEVTDEMAKKETLVFIDDVTLSGDSKSQAYPFFKAMKYKKGQNKKILLTMIASDLAINDLADIGVKVISAITLSSRNKCFHQDSEIFKHRPELLEPCRQMATHYGKIVFPEGPLGYKGGQYTFGFFYNTPDNSLPIFWSTNNEWNPIMRRYHKVYKDQVFEHERFV